MPMADEDARPHALTDEDVDRIVDRFVCRISDKRTVEQITDAWSGVVDRALGRGLRRLAMWVLMAVLLWGGIKFELIRQLFKG